MTISYTNVVFDPQFAEETNEMRYLRLLKAFHHKSKAKCNQQDSRIRPQEHYADVNKINRLTQQVVFCWNQAMSTYQEQIVIEWLARLNNALDMPENVDNLRQLALLKKQIANEQMSKHTTKYLLTVAFSAALMIALIFVCSPILPLMDVLGIACIPALVGAYISSSELLKAGFQRGLQSLQNSTNNPNSDRQAVESWG